MAEFYCEVFGKKMEDEGSTLELVAGSANQDASLSIV